MDSDGQLWPLSATRLLHETDSPYVGPCCPCKAPALLQRGAAKDPELDRRRQRHVETLQGYWAPPAQCPAGDRTVAALREEKRVGLFGRQVPTGCGARQLRHFDGYGRPRPKASLPASL